MMRINTPKLDYNNSLILLENDNYINAIKKLSNIGLRPHLDGIPDKCKLKRNNRIQVFLTTSKFADDTKESILTRSTILIQKSKIHTKSCSLL